MAGKKLLVADDSLTIQKVIRLALSNAPGEGYEIQAVSDGSDAVQQISLFRPDVVLIDVSLPGQNAFEVKRAVNGHSDLSHVRFILMSSAFEKYDEGQAEEVGFHGKLSKPFDPAHLRQVLSDALAQVNSRPSAPKPVAAPPKMPPPRPSALPQASSARAMEDVPQTVPGRIALVMPKEEDHLPTPQDHFASFEPPLAEPAPEGLSPSADAAPAASDLDPIQPLGQGPDADIRALTESTIRMSGLGDFNWSVDDSSKKLEPQAQPPRAPKAEVGRTHGEIGEQDLSNLKRQAPVIPPLDGFRDLSGVSFQLDPPGSDPMMGMPSFIPENAEEAPRSAGLAPPSSRPAAYPFAPPTGLSGSPDLTDFSSDESQSDHEAVTIPGLAMEEERNYSMSSAAPVASGSAMRTAPSITEDQIEEIVLRQIQGLLPGIAERLIKQEISRLLQDGP